MNTIQLAIVASAMAGAISASATVIGFDNLPTPLQSDGSRWGMVPTTYESFTWTGWEVTLADGTPGSYQAVYGNSYGAPSGPNFAYNGGTGNYTVSTASTPFNFDGATVTSFAMNNGFQGWSSHNLTINAYNGASLVGTWTGALLPSSFVTLPSAAHFANVTSVEFKSDAQGAYWGLDNFTFTPVPEPTTVLAGALLLLPFGMSTIRVIRKNRKA